MAETTTKEKPLSKADLLGFEFVIEADERRNGDILLQSIPGQRLRGAIDGSKLTIASTDQKLGKFTPTIPSDQAASLGALPKIPGMQLHVDPANLSYRITDPLRDNTDLCERIVSAMKTKGMASSNTKIVGVATLEGTLDVDRMKNLCREVRWLVDSEDARVVSGTVPPLEAIDAMKGNYLLNPGAQTSYTQPRYEKDFDSWVQRLAQGGG